MARKLAINKKTTQHDYDIIFVRWIDSNTATDRWQDIESINFEDNLECQTCGFLLDEREDRITVSASVGLNSIGKAVIADMAITIPKFSIIEWEVLRNGLVR